MATCKDCFHFEVCKHLYEAAVLAEQNAEYDCETFKDKSNTLKEEQTPSNADRIRAMSDEELAKFLATPCECTVDPTTDGYRECGNELCIRYLVEWLKKPAEE